MRTTSTLIALAASLLLSAQGRERTVKTDTGTVVLHYFTTGQPSSRAWTDADNRWGHSWAYDRSGRVIFDRQTRAIGGHASVTYSYHPNGAVSKAEVSDAPDGGIQWYRSTTTFDSEGEQTGFTEQGVGNDGPIPGPGVRVVREPPKVTTPAPQETVREQRMFTNEYFVVNRYRRPVRVELRPNQLSPAAQHINATLVKGDTLRGGTYSMGEQWVGPLSQMTVRVCPAKGRKKLGVVRTDSMQLTPDHRRYYLIVGKDR